MPVNTLDEWKKELESRFGPIKEEKKDNRPPIVKRNIATVRVSKGWGKKETHLHLSED